MYTVIMYKKIYTHVQSLYIYVLKKLKKKQEIKYEKKQKRKKKEKARRPLYARHVS